MDYFEEVVFKIVNADLMSFFQILDNPYWFFLNFFKSTELSDDSDIGFADYFFGVGSFFRKSLNSLLTTDVHSYTEV